MKTTYELWFKIEGVKPKLFDSYTDLNDPDIKKYYKALSKSKFNEWVKLIKVDVTKTDIDVGDLK